MDQYDVIIAGGGPAGASCAWKLSRAGMKCAILEKCQFPREKVCGGALSMHGSALLTGSGMISSDDMEKLSLCKHRSMSCWWKFDKLRSFTSDNSHITIVSRKEFDDFLIGKAIKAGCSFFPGDRITRVFPDGKVITDSGKKYGWSFLVGADGAGSIVRRKLFGPVQHRQGSGLEVFLPVKKDIPHELQIHFGLVPYGYGWVFPRGEDICFGVGVLGGGADSSLYRGILKELISRVSGSFSGKPAGGSIPYMAVNSTLGKGKVFLAGDAAGLVDQLSGEGISYAVESGFLVAEAIITGDRKSMIKKAKRGCMKRIRQSSFYRHMIYHPRLQPLAMKKLENKEKFFRGYWNLLSGHTSYNRMMLEFLKNR